MSNASSAAGLRTLAQMGGSAELSAIDLRFADLVARLAQAEHSELLAATAALVSRERGRGHPCVLLAQFAKRTLGDGADELRFPALDAWTAALRASGLVGDGQAPTPLVLEDGRCYLHRYWQAERRLAGRILDCVQSRPEDIAASAAGEILARLFPGHAAGEPNAQALAAATALRNRLTVISGGPGTGKTTTVGRILALLHSCRPALRVELAAPTGKAAARLTESMRSQADALPIAEDLRAKIRDTQARTIHRVLGMRSRQAELRYDERRPLPCDVLVVDEASMVDLLLMDALLAAVPRHARVLLVGDKDQLASVDAGFVFGDICEAAAAARADSPLRGAAVELTVAHRFRDRHGIAEAAEAVRVCDAQRAVALLEDPSTSDARRMDLPHSADTIVRNVEGELLAVMEAPDPATALARLAGLRILCVTHRGPWGVQALNACVERRLEERGHSTGERWYRGRPLLVTRNDYTINLFNGDIGVCFPDSEGRPRAWFAGADGLRSIVPGRLPSHDTAWAMTVHKSQGSEVAHVVFVVPAQDTPLLTRELVYTAITRARERVTVFAPADVLRIAIGRRSERLSGLQPLLRSA